MFPSGSSYGVCVNYDISVADPETFVFYPDIFIIDPYIFVVDTEIFVFDPDICIVGPNIFVADQGYLFFILIGLGTYSKFSKYLK